MDDLLLYLLKVSAGTTLLYLGYILFFSKDTFYKRNRVLLILTLILPVFLPAIKIPVISQSTVPVEPQIAFDNIINPGSNFAATVPITQHSFDYNTLFISIYFSIAFVFLLRGVISLISTFLIIKKGTVKDSQFPKVIISDIQIPPFSFFPYAVIPEEEYKTGNYNDILDHEFAHIRQGHTFDLLLGELFIAFQWFNPLAWHIKRSIVLNHEYLADRVSLSTQSVKEYQYRLLNFRIGLKNISLAHNFNSLIKNRIIMINKKPSHKYASFKNILILPVVACVMFACATPKILKTVIENPVYESSNVTYVSINKIEIRDSVTILHFQVRFTPGWWIDIPANTYIKPENSNEKVFVKSAEGIPLGRRHYMPESGEISYKLVFPKIDDQVERIDFGESRWLIKGIRIKPQLTKSFVPKYILGNWYNKMSGNWNLSFLEAYAVYKKQLWSYENVNLKRIKGSILLKSDTATAELYIKNKRNGTSLIGESPRKLIEYTKELALQGVNSTNDNNPFGTPVFREDSATYSGFFAGYNPVTGGKSFRIYFNDVISGGQNSFNIKISANGYFSAKIPVYYAHVAHIQSIAYTGSVFLEPGKDVFQMINTGINNSLFMGESAKINSDLVLLKNVNSFDYNEMRQRINSMTPAIYKTYCLNSLKKDLRVLDSIAKEKSICAKAYKIKKMDIEYIYASHILDYDWYFKSAYREQHNIFDTSQELPVKPEILTADYFDFLTVALVNNPIGFLSDNYNAFMHSFKNIALIQPESKTPVNLSGKSSVVYSSTISVQSAAQSAALTKKENFEKKLGLGQSIAIDIMFAQDQYQTISETLTPFSDVGLRNIREHISTPFIADYFDHVNNRLKSEFEAKKINKGYIVAIDDVISEKNLNEARKDLGYDMGVVKMLMGKDATDKYGEKGLNGVYEIITRKKALAMGLKPPFPRLAPEDFPTFQNQKVSGFTDWVISQIKYPAEAQTKKAEGWVSVNFRIELNGSVSNAVSTIPVDKMLSDEVLRAIQSSPKWDPPKNQNVDEPFSSSVTIKFRLPDQILNEAPFVVVEKMPTYPGGDKELMKFINDNVKYPEEAKAGNIQGRVILRFVVTAEGKAEGVTVLKSIHPLLDAEAVRVISLLKGWSPGMQGGKAVNVWYSVPVTF